MATPTNLYQYYSGMGQALPSVSQNAQSYQKYGLGAADTYSGTAEQNTALLGKLMGGGGYGNSSSSPAQPANTSSQSPTPSAGGYGGATTSDPTLSGDLSNLNGLQSQLQGLTAQQAADLNARTAQNQNTIANAYQTAMGQTGLATQQAAVNKMQDALVGSQNASASVIPQTVNAARGSMANNDQVNTQENTSNIPYAQAIAQQSASLVPAENLLNTTQQNTQNIAGQIVTGAQLNQAGFTAGQQEQLAALQSKITQGQALTNDEYNTYAQLTNAQINAAAQIKAANIGAGASIQGANIAANASIKNTEATNAMNKYLGALQYPGETVNGQGIGTIDLNSLLGKMLASKYGITTPNVAANSSTNTGKKTTNSSSRPSVIPQPTPGPNPAKNPYLFPGS